MSIKLVARRFEGVVLFEIMQFSQSESTRVTWFELTTDPCPKHSQTIARGVSLYSPDLSCICWILLCNIRVSLSTLAFHVGVGRLADWNSVASNIYSPYGSVTVPAKHTSTMDIKRLTRQALYREVRISQARCSIDFELWCKSNFAGCCDVLFACIFITLVTYVESFTEIAQRLFAVALRICVGSFHLVWPAIVHLQSLAYVSNSGRNLTLSSSVIISNRRGLFWSQKLAMTSTYPISINWDKIAIGGISVTSHQDGNVPLRPSISINISHFDGPIYIYI